jgi:hypothetical protein
LELIMKSVHIAAFVLVALVAAPLRSAAQPGDTKAAAHAEASAREHFRRGQRLSARGEYTAAYREFAAGYALTERPLFLFNMAEAARASGDVAKARDNYLQFLRVDPKNALAATAQARLAELDRAAGAAPTDAGTSAAASAPPASRATAPPGAQPGAAPGSNRPASAVTTPPAPTAEPPPVHALPPPHLVSPPAGASAPVSPPDQRLATVPEGRAAAPLWKQWPVWAVVGGVVAGSVVLYAATRSDGLCGGGCTEIDFR